MDEKIEDRVQLIRNRSNELLQISAAFLRHGWEDWCSAGHKVGGEEGKGPMRRISVNFQKISVNFQKKSC